MVLMISSLMVGKYTDHTRSYYSITILLLVLGGFVLAKCALCLNDEDGNLRINWYWLLVAALVGPLQPVATELGVDVAFPLSENTILVILQLFSNLSSAIFIPVFGSFRGYGNIYGDDDNGNNTINRPEYFVPLYMLIVLHSLATVFFATFNGKYSRLAHEKQKERDGGSNFLDYHQGENQPLLG